MIGGSSETKPIRTERLPVQKLEGSNPFSRFREGLHLQVFFARVFLPVVDLRLA